MKRDNYAFIVSFVESATDQELIEKKQAFTSLFCRTKEQRRFVNEVIALIEEEQVGRLTGVRQSA